MPDYHQGTVGNMAAPRLRVPTSRGGQTGPDNTRIETIGEGNVYSMSLIECGRINIVLTFRTEKLTSGFRSHLINYW